jgi:Domain of unknown function (DUF932)
MSTVAVPAFRQGGIQMKYFDNATDDDLMRVAPAIFGQTHGGKASYQQVRTIDLISSMRNLGWAVTMAGQVFKRDSEKLDQAKHLIRLRHQSAVDAKTAEFVPEALVYNAHDLSTAFRFYTGAFRFVCGNGLVFGELVSSLRMVHRDSRNGVGLAGAVAAIRSQELLNATPGNMALVEQYRNTIWSQTQVNEFAMRAINVRWTRPGGKTALCNSNDLLAAPRTPADSDGSAWGWFNHVQSLLCRDASAASGERVGGIVGHNGRGSQSTVRPVTHVAEVVRVNVGLWAAMRAVSNIGKEANAEAKVTVPA